MKAYPLRLSAVCKSPIWGGTRLLDNWHFKSDAPTVGEAWVYTNREAEQSVVQNGEYAGKEVRELLPDRAFPLLIKLIDAADRLSVQVHPDDAYAARVENDRGKTEMWYILEAEPGATLLFGLREGFTAKDFAESVREGDPLRALNQQPVKPGETYFIPAGMPHAIGRGILLAEIQQNCDLTYRVYDYDRTDAHGNKRQLHLEKALEVVRPFTRKEMDDIRFARAKENRPENLLADCPYFRVERLDCKKGVDLPERTDWAHLLCVAGEGTLLSQNETQPISKGDSILLPPGISCRLAGNATVLYSTL